jgi:pilus assembly protein CpaC
MVLPPTAVAGQVAARAADAVGTSQTEELNLLVGRSTIVKMDRPITRVSLSTPDVADALVTTPYELLVHGKTPGTISLLVWSDNGRIKTYDVAVKRDLSNLESQIRKLFPGEEITATSNGKDVVLSGIVSSKYIVDRASSLAVGYVEKPENVVNLLRQQDGPATNQVMLRVRFAEVSRSAMQELGASFFTSLDGKNGWIGRSTTQQYPAPIFDADKGLVFSDFLNLFLFNTDEDLGIVVKALKGKGLFQSLAEPNLITRDGQEATFLAGGEYPYPVVQGSGINAAVTVVFKEFGVRLRFTPTVTADGMIQLKVMPEVSTLDFGNAVVLSGFRVPALSTRRTETSVELRDGQTFAIAGMLDNNMNETLRRVPGIGDIPILGYLFRSQAYQKNSTELVVMITPHIVRRDSPGVTPNLPGLVQPYLGPVRRIPVPPPAFTSPMSFAPSSAPDGQTASEGRPSASPASQTATTNAPAAFSAPAQPVPQAPLDAPQSRADRASSAQAQRNSKKAAELAATIERKRAEQAAVQQRKDAEQAKRDEKKRAEEARKQSELKKKQDEIAAREAAIQAQRDGERARQAAKAEAERQEREKKELERLHEQQELDRKAAEKFAAEQAAEAARVKEAADRLAKEKADRDAELERLVTQYQKLTGQTPSR